MEEVICEEGSEVVQLFCRDEALHEEITMMIIYIECKQKEIHNNGSFGLDEAIQNGNELKCLTNLSISELINVPSASAGVVGQKKIRETQFSSRACQITFGTRHRKETLDSLAQVDNTPQLNH